jgi:hypothetical protein
MNKEVRKHFDTWLKEQENQLSNLENFNPPGSHAVVRVYRYTPPESTLVDSSKRIITLDGKDYSKKSRERNYPIAYVLKVGHIPEDQDFYVPGDLVSISLTLCEDRINPSWIKFNEESKERPLPQEIKVPDMYIEGLNSWGNHIFALNPLDFDSEENQNLFLVPTAYLKGLWNEI